MYHTNDPYTLFKMEEESKDKEEVAQEAANKEDENKVHLNVMGQPPLEINKDETVSG